MTSKINFKKIWALLIALVMMVSVFSLCVFAEDEGTGSDPATTEQRPARKPTVPPPPATEVQPQRPAEQHPATTQPTQRRNHGLQSTSASSSQSV